jgi:hypothetical protein
MNPGSVLEPPRGVEPRTYALRGGGSHVRVCSRRYTTPRNTALRASGDHPRTDMNATQVATGLATDDGLGVDLGRASPDPDAMRDRGRLQTTAAADFVQSGCARRSAAWAASRTRSVVGVHVHRRGPVSRSRWSCL